MGFRINLKSVLYLQKNSNKSKKLGRLSPNLAKPQNVGGQLKEPKSNQQRLETTKQKMFLPDFEKVAADSLKEKESSLLKFTDYCLYGLCAFFILVFLLASFLKL
jgi:hypothetical protein